MVTKLKRMVLAKMLVSMFVLSSQRVQEIMDDDQRESGRIPRTVECELTADLGMNLWSSNLVYEDFLPLVFKCIWKLTLKPLGVCYKYIFSPDKITQITKLFHNNKGKWSPTKVALDFQTNPPRQRFLKCNYRAMLRICILMLGLKS